ncbi:hypothetical protein HDU93_000248 [Gonapodya sp. JEL0774]|nr:hypothetical protein HDU93_000248 [Gonapodya sp. JEL0774]
MLSSATASLLPDESIDWKISETEVELKKRLAEGGYGEVYVGSWQTVTVAVKKLLGSSLTEDLRKDFMEEVNVWNKLRHPHVILLLGACMDSSNYFMVSEFMENGDVMNYLKKNANVGAIRKIELVSALLAITRMRSNELISTHPLSFYHLPRAQYDDTLPMKMRDIAKGMMYLHSRDIIHSDLKGLNVLVGANGQGLITDFGFARVRSALALVDLPGTAIYMPPERFLTGISDKAGDVYAFGITCYQIWTNSRPFAGGPEGEDLYRLIVDKNYRPDNVKPMVGAPGELVSVVRDCWADDPAQRPDFSSLVDRLNDILMEVKQSTPAKATKSSNLAVLVKDMISAKSISSKSVQLTERKDIQSMPAPVLTSGAFSLPESATPLGVPDTTEFVASNEVSLSSAVASLSLTLWGLLAVPFGASVPPTIVPLRRVAIQVNIVDCVASVTISQTYFNEGTLALEASYRFPIEEGAAINGFEAEVDGKVIRGLCKERGVAAKQYTEAVSTGKRAFLLEGNENNSNVFQILVGNIAPGQSATVRITYVQECATNLQLDELLFKLPATALSKLPNAALADSFAYPESRGGYKLTIDVDIRLTGGPASFVDSTSHSVDVSMDPENPKHTTVRLVQDSVYLDHDFYLVVRSRGLDKPRSALERNPQTGTTCAMVTFVPKFNLNTVSTEFAILVDRSGSMTPVIEIARSALDTLLAALPASATFNVIGFGSAFVPLFPNSVSATEDNKSFARERAVTNFAGDMGGCNLLSALEAVAAAPIRSGQQRSVMVTWGDQIQPTPSDVNKTSLYQETIASRKPSIQSAPFHSPPLYPGQRYISYAILDETVPDPSIVQISGVGIDGPMELKVEIPRDNILESSAKPLLHVMAARKLVQDVEEGTSWLHALPGEDVPVSKLKAEIVDLGTTYGIATRYTSYVAISRDDKPATLNRVHIEVPSEVRPSALVASKFHGLVTSELQSASAENLPPSDIIPSNQSGDGDLPGGGLFDDDDYPSNDFVPSNQSGDGDLPGGGLFDDDDYPSNDFVPSNQSGEGDLPGGGLFDDDDYPSNDFAPSNQSGEGDFPGGEYLDDDDFRSTHSAPEVERKDGCSGVERVEEDQVVCPGQSESKM